MWCFFLKSRGGDKVQACLEIKVCHRWYWNEWPIPDGEAFFSGKFVCTEYGWPFEHWRCASNMMSDMSCHTICRFMKHQQESVLKRAICEFHKTLDYVTSARFFYHMTVNTNGKYVISMRNLVSSCFKHRVFDLHGVRWLIVLKCPFQSPFNLCQGAILLHIGTWLSNIDAESFPVRNNGRRVRRCQDKLTFLKLLRSRNTTAQISCIYHSTNSNIVVLNWKQ